MDVHSPKNGINRYWSIPKSQFHPPLDPKKSTPPVAETWTCPPSKDRSWMAWWSPTAMGRFHGDFMGFHGILSNQKWVAHGDFMVISGHSHWYKVRPSKKGSQRPKSWRTSWSFQHPVAARTGQWSPSYQSEAAYESPATSHHVQHEEWNPESSLNVALQCCCKLSQRAEQLRADHAEVTLDRWESNFRLTGKDHMPQKYREINIDMSHES